MKINSFKLVMFLFIIIICIIFIMQKYKKENIANNNLLNKKYNNISFYNSNYKNRYKRFENINKNLSIKEIVTRVNIGLDYSFYTHIKKTPYLNKDYILVNKYLYLDKDYIPNTLENISILYSKEGMKLVSNAKNAFEDMAKDALNDNIKIIAMSSYRNYEYQKNLYNNYVANDGVLEADTYSARAGFSEHQTGLCVDIYDGIVNYTNFDKSNSFKWMQKNAYKYGFILRYPKEKKHITGYQYESWHYRYVGKKIAEYIYKHNITFDEYYVQNIENNY